MRVVKAGVIVGILAVVAILGTVLGVAKSDDWASEHTYRFDATQQELPATEPSAAGSAPARFAVPMADNATAARLELRVVFTGQAVQGGSAVVRVKALAPDGQTVGTVTAPLVVGQGATAAEATLLLDLAWLPMPGPVVDTRQPDGHAWTAPLLVDVTVERPADLPVATYSFTAQLSGHVDGYVATQA